MKIIIFYLVCLLPFFTCSASQSALTGTTDRKLNTQPVINAVVDKNGVTKFYALAENGTYTWLDEGSMQKIVNDLTLQAKDLACNLKVSPAQVSISAGFVSLTWNRDELCEKKQKSN